MLHKKNPRGWDITHKQWQQFQTFIATSSTSKSRVGVATGMSQIRTVTCICTVRSFICLFACLFVVLHTLLLRWVFLYQISHIITGALRSGVGGFSQVRPAKISIARTKQFSCLSLQKSSAQLATVTARLLQMSTHNAFAYLISNFPKMKDSSFSKIHILQCIEFANFPAVMAL
jgi:hypothetical protein